MLSRIDRHALSNSEEDVFSCGQLLQGIIAFRQVDGTFQWLENVALEESSPHSRLGLAQKTKQTVF